MLLLIISLIAGVLTVLAPCVLPLLPVIVGGSLTGEMSKKRAVVVTISLGTSVILFTLLLKASTLFINIPQMFWVWVSGIIILFFGLITLFPKIWDKISFTAVLNRKSNQVLAEGVKRQTIWGAIIVGAALGPVFSTCSPTYFLVLASVLPVSPVLGFIYILAYTLGLCVTLLIIALVGQRIINRLGIAADPESWLRKAFGIIFILVGITILSGLDKKLEAKILSSGVFDITKLEQKLLAFNKPTNSQINPENLSLDFNPAYQKVKAPEITNPAGFINTNGQPITISQFKNKKVVLIDIWTYSCINCQRTLPYIKAWYEKYKDQGLEIIGIHTPEFAFEKLQSNVEKAVREDEITYPVVLDNNYGTWNAFGNQYWPRKYLIDKDGYIIYDHIGEGNYDETEKAIQKALGISGDVSQPKNVMSVDGRVGSPEIYFGSARSGLKENNVVLSGSWKFAPEYAENSGAASITYTYQAKNVYIVASSKSGVDIDIYQDNKFIKTEHIQAEKLYTLIQGTNYKAHTLEIKIKNSGLQAFTFTFG